jgi:hypothetical protein
VVLSGGVRGGIGAFAVRRVGAERLYVVIAGVGTAVYTRGGSRPELLTDRGPLVVGEFSWVGDTLAVQGWRSWTRFDAALRAVGCVPFVDAHNEFVTQVFPDLLLGGGLTVGELLPPYPDSRLTEALVDSRNQSVLRTLFQRRSGSGKRFQVPMDSGSGYWEVPEPFGMVSPWDVADDGSAAVFVSVDRPRHVGNAPAKITWVSIAGDTVARTVVQLPVVRVTRPAMAAEADQFAEGELDQSLGVDTSGLRGRFLDHVRFPKLHPPLTAAVIEVDRAVWVRVSTNTDSVESARTRPSGRASGSAGRS